MMAQKCRVVQTRKQIISEIDSPINSSNTSESPQTYRELSEPPAVPKSIALRLFLANWAATFITYLPYCQFTSLLVDRLLQIVEGDAR